MDKNGKQKMEAKLVSAIVFLIIVAVFFVANMPQLLKIFNMEIKAVIKPEHRSEFLSPSEVESEYDFNFYGKLKFVGVNGAVHRLMGNKLANTAILSNNGKLFLEVDTDYRFDSAFEDKNLQTAFEVMDTAEKEGSEVLFVKRPVKYQPRRDQLPYGKKIEYYKQYDYWNEQMKQHGIATMDMTEKLGDKLEFYNTDHHWTVETSFYAAKNIAEYFNGSDVVKYYDKNNYKILDYKNSFLGSEGIKVGKYFAGNDDFIMLIPKFHTDLRFRHYEEGKKAWDITGDFEKVFVDKDILKDTNYNNKYNACMRGAFAESVIENYSSTIEKRLLIISDSFSRPMTMYLSTAFSEVRYLDPQEGRYNDSLTSYIREYKPDAMVMMYSGEFFQK